MKLPPKLRSAVVLGLVLAADGCKRDEPVSGLAGDDRVLAQVNGHAITHYDLMQSARSMLGPAALAELDKATTKNLLDGLVQSRAIADKREAELTADERKALDKQVAAYREQQLVKQYLGKHTKPKAVSPELVARYYEDHSAEFTPAKVRSYELLTSSRPVVDAERGQLITALRDPASRKDWSAWSNELAKKRLPVVYQRGTDQSATLDASLRSIIGRLREGEASQLTFIDGRVYLVRVSQETALPPKPLSQVTAEIRRALEPVQVRASVERAAEVAMKDAKVEYR